MKMSKYLEMYGGNTIKSGTPFDDSLIPHYVVPLRLHSDRGKKFEADILTKLLCLQQQRGQKWRGKWEEFPEGYKYGEQCGGHYRRNPCFLTLF